MPLIIAFCHKHHLYDRLNDRKVNSNSKMPRLGGVGIGLSFILAVTILRFLQIDEFHVIYGSYSLRPIIIGATIIFLMGLFDDLLDLRALLRFVLQSAAALIVMFAGYRFKFMIVPFGKGVLNFGAFSYPLTFLWIVGITNAINLIDGIDVLADGFPSTKNPAHSVFSDVHPRHDLSELSLHTTFVELRAEPVDARGNVRVFLPPQSAREGTERHKHLMTRSVPRKAHSVFTVS